MSRRVLIIDDDVVFAKSLSRAFSRRGIDSDCASHGDAAIRMIGAISYTDVIVDLNIGDESGLHLLVEVRRRLPTSKILMLTGYASIATTVTAIKQGADNYLAKPASADDILHMLDSGSNHMSGISEVPARPMSVARLEWEHIQRVLGENGGNVSATARALNMHRKTLQRKLNKKPVSR
jgi:two-component system, response regulator RegA